jgi:hypothetical protein
MDVLIERIGYEHDKKQVEEKIPISLLRVSGDNEEARGKGYVLEGCGQEIRRRDGKAW